MHFCSYDKILGETLFEAKVKAEKTYGKNNFSVITSKKVKHPIFFGLGHREMFEITIGIIKNIDKHNVITEIPSRPSPSIELRTPQHAYMNSNNFEEPDPLPVKPVKPSVHGVRAYTSSARPVGMREVHGLRSNQEGSQEPKPQKMADNGTIPPEQIANILDEIRALKETRKRQEKIAKPVLKKPAPEPIMQTEPIAKIPLNIEAYEKRLNEMYELLHNMNQRFGQALQKETPQLPEGLTRIRKNLINIETPAEIADEIIFELQDELPRRALQNEREALKYTGKWLHQSLSFSSDSDFCAKPDGPRIVALIGPTGVGKTTTIAKIAASYSLKLKEKLSIALFTLDTYRIGATDQLLQYAQIIDVDMEILYSPEDLDSSLQKHSDKDLIIIDTAGRCQKDAVELKELKKILNSLPDLDKFLVLSATAKFTDMLETVECFDKVGFEHLIFTKIDETNTFGPLLALLLKTGKSLAYLTDGQRVPDDFKKADFDFFASHLFPGAEKSLTSFINEHKV
jgi:flagellar biosynthesis protein FlhF